jgi:hypothetical protein
MGFDLLDPEVRQNPYPYFAQLRNHAPVYWMESLQSWALTAMKAWRPSPRTRNSFLRRQSFQQFSANRIRCPRSTGSSQQILPCIRVCAGS